MTGPERVARRSPRLTPDIKLYHASPVRFRHGDVLTGGRGGGAGYAHDNICMTTNPDPHVTIKSSIAGWSGFHPVPSQELTSEWAGLSREEHKKARDDWETAALKKPLDWFVYEVEPITDLKYVEGNHEYQARAVKIVKVVGKGSAFLQKRPETSKGWAYPPEVERHRKEKQKERQDRRERDKDDDSTLASRVAARFLIASDYLQVNDVVLYGKYKNHRGKILGFGKDKWGNPTMEIEPIPKGRKSNKIMGLFKVWRADVKENALKQQALEEAARLGKTSASGDDEEGDDDWEV